MPGLASPTTAVVSAPALMDLPQLSNPQNQDLLAAGGHRPYRAPKRLDESGAQIPRAGSNA
jgi:hypothetical protein